MTDKNKYYNEKISICFSEEELIPIIARYYGYTEKDVDLSDYADEEIKEIILDMIM